MPVREADAYGAGILADALTLLMDKSRARQPRIPRAHFVRCRTEWLHHQHEAEVSPTGGCPGAVRSDVGRIINLLTKGRLFR